MGTTPAVEIPDILCEGVDRHVRAWQARGGMLPMASRLAATNIAARLGVFSNEALVDFYRRLVEDESAPEAATEKAQAMRTAYVGNDVAQRLEAMQRFWFQEGADRKSTRLNSSH